MAADDIGDYAADEVVSRHLAAANAVEATLQASRASQKAKMRQRLAEARARAASNATAATLDTANAGGRAIAGAAVDDGSNTSNALIRPPRLNSGVHAPGHVPASAFTALGSSSVMIPPPKSSQLSESARPRKRLEAQQRVIPPPPPPPTLAVAVPNANVVPTGLIDLPSELILKVAGFAQAGSPSSWDALAGVCRRFALVLRHPKAINKELLALDIPAVADRDGMALARPESISIGKLLRRAHQLHTLILNGAAWLDDEALQRVLGFCPSLRVLGLSFCERITPIGIADALNSAATATLNELMLSSTALDDSGLAAINPTKLSGLARLDIAHCDGVSDAGIGMIVEAATELKVAEFDGLRFCTIRGVGRLVAAYASTLTCLVLDGADLTDPALAEVAKCKRLRRLAFSFCEDFTDAGLLMLCNLEELEALKLRKGVGISASFAFSSTYSCCLWLVATTGLFLVRLPRRASLDNTSPLSHMSWALDSVH